MQDARKLVSFIIPHKGREELLRQTLQSIAAQQFDLSSVEVIVVTQNETLAKATILPESRVSPANRLSIEVIVRPVSDTISALRNAGVWHSSGEYLVFLDADVEIAPNWLDSMLKVLNAVPDRVLVSAVQVCGEHATTLEKIRTTLSNAVTDTDVRFLPGRNLLLRRETFLAVSGFPEHLITCEDYYFTDQVSRLGKLYYSTESRYVHLGEDKHYGEMFKKEIWRGQSNLQSMRGRRIPLSELPSFLVPVWILVFLICAFLELLSGQLHGMLMSLILALLPILLYSLRLYRLSRGVVRFSRIIQFYAVYFMARIVGTFSGLFKAIPV